jgi:hypothetical protein
VTEMTERGDDASAIRRLLETAASLAGQSVSLRCDTDNWETVYVEAGRDGVVVHDRGETFSYLARGTNETYVAWSARRAAAGCLRFGVELEDTTDEVSASYTIERRVEDGELLADVVRAVSDAIDAVFRSHIRDDLRGSGSQDAAP